MEGSLPATAVHAQCSESHPARPEGLASCGQGGPRRWRPAQDNPWGSLTVESGGISVSVSVSQNHLGWLETTPAPWEISWPSRVFSLDERSLLPLCTRAPWEGCKRAGGSSRPWRKERRESGPKPRSECGPWGGHGGGWGACASSCRALTMPPRPHPAPGSTAPLPSTAQGERKVKALGKEAQALSWVGGCASAWPGGRMVQIGMTDRGHVSGAGCWGQ